MTAWRRELHAVALALAMMAASGIGYAAGTWAGQPPTPRPPSTDVVVDAEGMAALLAKVAELEARVTALDAWTTEHTPQLDALAHAPAATGCTVRVLGISGSCHLVP